MDNNPQFDEFEFLQGLAVAVPVSLVLWGLIWVVFAAFGGVHL